MASHMKTRFVGIKEFRQNMAKISDAAYKKRQTIVILRKNRPMFQLLPILADDEGVYTAEFTRGILEGERDIAEGKVYSQEEMEKRYGIKPKKRHV